MAIKFLQSQCMGCGGQKMLASVAVHLKTLVRGALVLTLLANFLPIAQLHHLSPNALLQANYLLPRRRIWRCCSCSRMFCKPKHLKPTKHLFVGNCGTALGLSATSITTFLETFGACAVHAPDGASHTFASFGTADAAVEAVRALSGRPVPELGDRVLTVKHSDVKAEKVLCPLPMHRLHCTSALHMH